VDVVVVETIVVVAVVVAVETIVVVEVVVAVVAGVEVPQAAITGRIPTMRARQAIISISVFRFLIYTSLNNLQPYFQGHIYISSVPLYFRQYENGHRR
jgi:hypothetical protein